MDEAKTLESGFTTNGEGLPKQSSEPKDGSTGQDHVQKHGPTDQDHVQEDNAKVQDQIQEDGHVQKDDFTGQHSGHTGQNHVHEDSSTKRLEKSKSQIGDIDTTAPFESVKAAVSMFSGTVDWKTHKFQITERRKRVAQELRKAQEEISFFKEKSEAAEESKQQVLMELNNAKRRVEELKLKLETAKTEETEAKQDAGLIKLRVEEMEQGIADESSLAAKAQVEIAQARHQTAVSKLKMVKLDLENLQKDYGLLLSDKDLAVKNAEEAVFNCEKSEKHAEELTIRLIITREALESAHGAFLEAEERRTEEAMAREHEIVNRNEELKQSQEESEKISQQMIETDDLNSKLDNATVLFQDLKGELASYLGETHKDIQSAVDTAKTDLKQLKLVIEKTEDEVSNMKLYANSLNSELEQEKATLIAIKRNEWTEEVVIASLEADLMGTISEVAVMQMKENETQLEKAAEQAKDAKSQARKAHKEFKKAKKAANEAKKQEHALINKLNVAIREVEAARASERLAYGAISAAEESEAVRTNETEPESENITLSVQHYDELSRKAEEAEDEAKDRVSKAISEIDLAKESEVKAVRMHEQVRADLVTKKEELSTTLQKAEKAKERKVVVEQELRIKRSERSKVKKDHTTGRKEKKRSLIPRMCLFLCMNKGRHSRNK